MCWQGRPVHGGRLADHEELVPPAHHTPHAHPHSRSIPNPPHSLASCTCLALVPTVPPPAVQAVLDTICRAFAEANIESCGARVLMVCGLPVVPCSLLQCCITGCLWCCVQVVQAVVSAVVSLGVALAS